MSSTKTVYCVNGIATVWKWVLGCESLCTAVMISHKAVGDTNEVRILHIYIRASAFVKHVATIY